MKANELRISNMLLFDGQPQYVSSIHSDDTIRLSWKIGGERHGCYKTNNKKIEPIPLTEELLVRFGFKNGCLEIVNGLLLWVDDELWITYTNGIRSGCLSHIKYVHQLQNLYFALTGEELTLSE